MQTTGKAAIHSRAIAQKPSAGGEMRGFLKEHSGAFDPDEVHILVAAFDKAWETVQASRVVYPEAKAEAARARKTYYCRR
jgi:hypothetical protein